MADKVKQIAKHIKAISDILELPTTESNEQTPTRVAKMFCNEIFRNRNNNNIEELNNKMKTFPNEYQNDMIIIKDIPTSSYCEHHWLPFTGKCTIGYVPNNKVLGLSKFPRVVKFFSQKPQLQEQLTKEILDYLMLILDPVCLIIEMEAEHMCVKCRGAESECSTKTFMYYNANEKQIYRFYELRK